MKRADALKQFQSLSRFVPAFLTREASQNLSWLIMAAGVFLCYRLAGNYVLNQMYDNGSYGDGKIFATTLWRNGWDLKVPGIYIDKSFFKLHMCLILWLPTFISYYFPIDRIPYLADCEGVFHGLLAFTVMGILQLLWPSKMVAMVLARTAMGVLFAFNPITQGILTQDLIEVIGIALALLFLLALVRQQPALTWLAFILALSVREDVGLHLFGLISVVVALDIYHGVSRRLWEPWAFFALCGLVYSIVVLLIQHYVVGAYGNFNAVYVGHDYDHATWDFVGAHLVSIFYERTYIWFSALLALAWSVRSKNYYIVAGYASTVPWFILSVLAHSSAAGVLAIHYAYPFDIAGGWCFLAATPAFLRSRDMPAMPAKAAIYVVFPLLLFFSQQISYEYHTLHFASIFRSAQLKPKVSNKAIYDSLEVRLTTAKNQLKRLKVDDPVKTIASYAMNRTDDVLSIRKNSEGLYPPPQTNIDSLMYMPNSYGGSKEELKKIIDANGLINTYWLPGTNIMLVTNFDLQEAPAFSGFFAKVIGKH